MEAEKAYQNKMPRTIQQKRGGGALEFVDNRQGGILQAVAEPVQRLEEEDETLQGKFENAVQRLGDEEDETLQGKFAQMVQREEDDDEALQGQEQHLPHEAWHVAQQMAGRVEPTTEVGGLPVNDNMDLEHEADVMGAKANSY